MAGPGNAVLAYKYDDFGNPIEAKVHWPRDFQAPTPIGKIDTLYACVAEHMY